MGRGGIEDSSRLGRPRIDVHEYVVDAQAVAEAMLASGVLVASQPAKLASAVVQQHEAGPRRDPP
jgi:hypothetical protein